jgi:hypothetical protein
MVGVMSANIGTLDDFLALLNGVKRQSNGQFMALCPGHDDRKNSLGVSEADSKILLHCFAGCELAAILAPLGLEARDLNLNHRKAKPENRIVEAIYDYTDAQGNVLFQKVRYKPKSFAQRRPDGHGGWIWNLDGVSKVLYHLPEVIKGVSSGETIYLPEGEKDVENLRAEGLLATCNPSGAGEWNDSYTEVLTGARVVVLADKDLAGRKHAHHVVKSLAGKAASIKLLELPGDEVKDVTDWLAAGGTREGLVQLADEARELASTPDEVLPDILVTDRQLREMTTDVSDALYASNKPETVFVRSSALVRVNVDEAGIPFAEFLTEPSLRGSLTRAANFVKLNAKGDLYAVSPPLDVVRDFLSLGQWDFPPLVGITQLPIVRPDGTVMVVPGYDSVTHLYYAPPRGFVIPDIPEIPTQAQIRDAIGLIEEVICDFPYDSQASRANGLAALITPICRPMIGGQAPAFVIDKPQPGTGASLHSEVISLVVTGQSAAMMELPKTDEELEKKLVAALMQGRSIVVIDNIEGVVDSPTLARFLTSRSPEGRILGKNQLVRLANDGTTYILNGNNVKFGRNLIRRVYCCRLDARHPRPWMRPPNFKHVPLDVWVLENRGRIIAAIITVIRAWVLAGRPSGPNVHMGGFDEWATAIAGILYSCGVQGFLENLSETYSNSDTDATQWSGFLGQLHERYAEAEFTVADLVQLMKDDQADGKDRLSSVLPDSINRDLKKINRSLGNAISKHADARCDNGLMIKREGERKHAVTWKVVRYCDGGELGSQEKPNPPSNSLNEISKSTLDGELGSQKAISKTHSITNCENIEIESSRVANPPTHHLASEPVGQTCLTHPANTPHHPDYPCHACGGTSYWLRLRGGAEWLCCRCHPDPEGAKEVT